MALLQDSTGYYLEPTTGQYYSPYTAPARTYNPYGYMGMGGMGSSNPALSIMGMNNLNQAPEDPEGLMSFDGKQYVPFTGSAAGINQGKRSVVDALVGGRQPYQYNVPSLASMFPSLQGQMQGQMPMQGNAGVSRFMSGLLNSMPTSASSTTQAPFSSGAGRFLSQNNNGQSSVNPYNIRTNAGDYFNYQNQNYNGQRVDIPAGVSGTSGFQDPAVAAEFRNGFDNVFQNAISNGQKSDPAGLLGKTMAFVG